MRPIISLTPKQLPRDFKALLRPSYQAVTLGDWTLFRAPDIHRSETAYFTASAPMPAEYWVLTRKGQVWMSLTPLEMQSQGYHARLANGNVVVMGLGMGTLVYNLLRNPKVTSITICEREQEVVELLMLAAPWFNEAVKSGRVELHINDALNFHPGSIKPDVLLVDIWRGLGSPQAEADVMQIQHNVGAGHVGWWGQELALVLWIYQKYDMLNLTFRRDHTEAYETYLGFKLLGGAHQNYPTMLRAASINVVAAMMNGSIRYSPGQA